MRTKCNVCDRPLGDGFSVPSNVRAFKDQRFTLAQCNRCKTIHLVDDVDLEMYYAKYPFFKEYDESFVFRLIYNPLARRLSRLGFDREKLLLDFGCGSGFFVQYLKNRSYQSFGYDKYSRAYQNEDVLNREYDFVINQDVIEHVEDPFAYMRKLADLLKEGGVLYLGTPDAARIDVLQTEKYLHNFHAPYHLHIYTKDSIVEMARSAGLKLITHFPTSHTESMVPTLNSRFGYEYMKSGDNTLDECFEAVSVSRLIPLLINPKSLFLMFFGYFLRFNPDMALAFKKES